ncbi:MAG: hypothetical protein AAGD01_18145, partial [Acidobacteriota bacterium]
MKLSFWGWTNEAISARIFCFLLVGVIGLSLPVISHGAVTGDDDLWSSLARSVETQPVLPVVFEWSPTIDPVGAAVAYGPTIDPNGVAVAYGPTIDPNGVAVAYGPT